MTLRLLLVRHGLSSFNREHRIQGRNDSSTLTVEGKQQASQLGKALADLKMDAVYSSPLQRAADTAKYLLKEHANSYKPIFDDELMEIDLGLWSGLTINEVKEKFPEEYNTWKQKPNDLTLKREDGNPYRPIEELLTQASTFLKKLLTRHSPSKDGTILIVGHNAILRCLILSLIGNKGEAFRRLQLDNTSLSVFNVKPHSFNSYQVQLECLNNTTHLEPSLPLNKKYARLILVRHGETDWNQQGRFQGQIDIPLNQNGLSQATAARHFLSSQKINRAYSSSMTRPMQTAQEILKSHPGIKLESKEELIEIGHGLWEGKLESEIKTTWPNLLLEWKNSPEKVQMPEGETLQEVWNRSVECWEDICSGLAPNETALVVAHDAVNKTILCNLLGLTPSDIWMVKQGNGCVTIIDISIDPNQPDVVTCLNITSHLGGVLDQTAKGAL